MTALSRPGAFQGALGRVFRFAVGVGLTAWLIAAASPRDVVNALSRTNLVWIGAALALVLLDRALMAYRWLLLLRAIEPARSLPFRAVMRVFFVSTFVGTFLPASVGGDAVRAVSLSRLHVPAADAFASVVVDRLLGVLSMLLMATGGLVLVRQILDNSAISVLALAVAGAVGISGLLLFDARVLSGIVAWATSRHLPRVGRVAGQVLDAIRQYGRRRDTLATVLAASAVVQALRTLQAWCLGMALGIPAGLVWYFAFVPVIVLVMTLPISIAGLGTSQLGFQLLFGLVGVASADALALSVLFLALGVAGNLPGGWLFITGRRAERTVP